MVLVRAHVPFCRPTGATPVGSPAPTRRPSKSLATSLKPGTAKKITKPAVRAVRSYSIKVATSSAKNAGTDANISAVLTGSFGGSGTLKLNKSKTNKNKFEKGKTDVFDFEIKDLGELTKIKLVSDGSKGLKLSHPEWYVPA